jgi:hypothetical protein
MKLMKFERCPKCGFKVELYPRTMEYVYHFCKELPAVIRIERIKRERENPVKTFDEAVKEYYAKPLNVEDTKAIINSIEGNEIILVKTVQLLAMLARGEDPIGVLLVALGNGIAIGQLMEKQELNEKILMENK